MPRFVPVSNPELARDEQDMNSAENIKHRKFDNPHAVLKTKDKVDRGWEQGSLGWGVLGSFGSKDKDDGSHIVQKNILAAEGVKMVKNEKGLWVKVKDSSNSSSSLSSRKGAGRGGGIPVFGHDSSSTTVDVDYKKSNRKHDDHNDHDERYQGKNKGHNRNDGEDSHRRSRDDSSDSSKSRDVSRDKRQSRDESSDRHRRSRDDSSDSSKSRDVSRDKRRSRDVSRDKRRSRDDSSDRHRRSRDDSSDRHRRSRDDSRDKRRSRDDSSDRHRRSRDDSRDKRRSRDYSSDRNRRSRDDSRDKRRSRDYSSDRHRRSREDSRDKRRSRDYSSDRHRRSRDDSRNHDRHINKDKKNDEHEKNQRNSDHHDTKSDVNKHSIQKNNDDSEKSDENHMKEENITKKTKLNNDDDDVDNDENADNETDLFRFNAVQIINRFLEVFSNKKLESTQRILNISELFQETAIISSLKTQKLLVNGREMIRNSFLKTTPVASECSYRLFIPCHKIHSPTVSYCLDLHEPETSPGLGDRSKDMILLYQCDESESKIMNIWGAVDSQNLASKKGMTELELYQSTAWKLVLNILMNKIGSCFDHTYPVHFHDYTNIETI